MNAWHRHFPKGSEHSEVELLAGETLPSVWVSQWREQPQRAVVHDPGSGWVHGQELLDRSEVVAQRLGHTGVGPGDRVLLSASSSVELVVAHVAILRLGAARANARSFSLATMLSTFTRVPLSVSSSEVSS